MLRLIAIAALAVAALSAQEPYRSLNVETRIYSTGDTDLGRTALPYLDISCNNLSGRIFERYGERYPFQGPAALRVWSDGWEFSGPTGRISSGPGTLVLGTGAGIDVHLDSSQVLFNNTAVAAVLEALRLNPDTLPLRLMHGEMLLQETELAVSGFDACQVAHACGQAEEIRAACGPSVRPAAPSLKLLKQDIEAVLDRYPVPSAE